MTQHTYQTTRNERPVRIRMAWDRLLQYYFCDAVYIGEDEGDEVEFLYPAVHAEHPFTFTLEDFRRILVGFDLSVPEAMLAAIAEDTAHHLDNKPVRHYADERRVQDSDA